MAAAVSPTSVISLQARDGCTYSISVISADTAPTYMVYPMLTRHAETTRMFPSWVLGSIWRWNAGEILTGLMFEAMAVVLTCLVLSNILRIHSHNPGLLINPPITLIVP